MKKRILSALLVLAMILSMAPAVVVTAAGSVAASPKAGTHATTGHVCEECGATEWLPWPTEGTFPTDGHYYLTGNVELTTMVKILAGQKLHLCLNGYVITKTGTNRPFSVSEANAEMVVCDCTAYTDGSGVYHAGAITGGKNTGTSGGGAFYVYADSVLKLYDGIITGNTHQNDKAGGGAITLRKKDGSFTKGGSFYMYGGEISGNTSVKTDGTTLTTGGAIYAFKGSVIEINGGTIANNTASTGGAIYALPSASVTIKNATISGNSGSAIYADKDTTMDGVNLTVENTTFTGNAGTSGGAIRALANAQVSITGSTFTGNTATNGGAIYGTKGSDTHADAVGAAFTLKDTVITGNTGTSTNTQGRCAAFYLDSSNKVTLSGKMVIAGNNMAGLPGTADLTWSASKTFTLHINDLTDGSRINYANTNYAATEAKEVLALNTQQTAPWNSGWLTHTDKTGTTREVGLVNGEFVWGHYHGDKEYTALENADQLIAGGSYYLAGDVQLTKLAKMNTTGSTLDLCLNGHDLKAADGAFILQLAGSRNITATIDDCSAYTDEDGVYHAGALTGADTGTTGGAIYVGTTCTLYLMDGKITGNKAANAAGVILYGTMYMQGGEISDNTTTKNGAAVYVGKNTGVFYMQGGTIKNNSTVTGTVYVGANAQVEISGGEITGNTASTNAGGVFVTSDTALSVSGDAKITGNTAAGKANNVYLSNGTLKATGLTEGAEIGITLNPEKVAAGELTLSDTLEGNPTAYITSDDTAYEVELVDKKLTLVENTTEPPVDPPVSTTHKHNGCNDTSCTDHAEIEYQAWTDATKLPTEGNWYLATDVTVSATHTYAANTNTTLNLCLNGKTITQKSGTSAQMYNSKADAGVTITIADCTAKEENGTYTAGKITGFTMDSTTEGSAMYLRKGTTLNIFDGIFTGNKTLKKSAGVLMINGVLNIYRAEFSNNQAGATNNYNGGAIYLNQDSLATIKNVTFKGNSGKQGGAVYAGRDAYHVFENVTFIGNTASDVGGAVNVGTSKAQGVTFKSCVFENNGLANVAQDGNKKGNAMRVSGVARLEDCVFTNNAGEGTGAVYVSDGAELTIAGSTTMVTNGTRNLYIETQETILVDNFTGKVGVALSNVDRAFTGACSDLTENFFSDKAEFTVSYKDGKMYLGTAAVSAHTHCVCGEESCTEHEQVAYTLWTNETSLPKNGNICLDTDVTLSGSVTIDGNLNLCLNGHTITSTGTGGILSLPNKELTLTISDCTAKTENGVYTAGKITGGVNTSDGGGGAIFVRAGGTLKLYDGIISDSKTLRDGGGGGAIMLQSTKNEMISSFYMYGGEISGNAACSADGTPDRLGGGIYAYQHSVLVIEGGVIKNNQAGTGAGIYAANSRVTLGGQVIDNTASVSGGGIYMTIGATIQVNGAANVIGNTAADKASNLCLDGNQKMAVGTLDAAAKIAVTGVALTFFTEPCADYTNNFISDNAKFQVTYKDGAMFLDANGNHKHCFCAATSSHCDHTTQTFVEWDDPTTLPTAGSYYLTVDVEMPAQIYLEAAELNLCLNGHTVKVVADDTRAIYTKGDAVLRITDCAENPGMITGGTRGAVVTESNTESQAYIELWNGIITGNSTTTSGGAFLLQGATTMKMYGGKITNNYAKSLLKTDAEGKPVVDEKGNQEYTSNHGGGGISVHGAASSFYLYGGEISNNKVTSCQYKKDGKMEVAGGFGAGLYSYKASVYIHGGKIINNTTNRSGGGVFGYAGTTFELTGGEISGNKTESGRGGGVYLASDCVATISGGAIINNYSGSSAGGFYANTRSKVTMTGGKISNNRSKSSGAGVMLSGKDVVMTMTGGQVSGNYSEGSAGGFLVQSGAHLKLQGVTISGNSCKSNGGGIYVSTNSFFTFDGATVTGNHAKGGAGGILVAANSKANFYGGSISYNSTDKAAAGIRFNGATVYMNGTRIVGNKSVSSGSGLMTNKSTATINNVKVEMGVKLTMENCYIAENFSEGSAGGLLFQSLGTEVTMTGCTIEKNEAKASGGGMYASSNIVLNMKDCVFSENLASGGGGMRVNKCLSAKLENIVVKNNISASNGGGVYLTGKGLNAELINVEVYGNEATNGAGLSIQTSCTVKLSDMKIYDNKATSSSGGAIYMASTVNVEMENIEMYNNEAPKQGGGFYIGAGSSLKGNNLSVHNNRSGNIGGGIHSGGNTVLTNCVIANNAADGNGGGVHTAATGSRLTGLNGRLKLIDCQITDNTAGNQGGAMFVLRAGPVEMENVTMTGNEAGLEGGAIYADGKMNATNITITDNTSLAGKHIVYLTPAEYDGHTYYAGRKSFAGTVIIKDNEGGGVYLSEGIPLVIEGQLGEGSVIPVTLSDGVVTKRVVGVYDYEGGNLEYVLTPGTRSLTEPEVYLAEEEPTEPGTESTEDTGSGAGEDNTMLYVGIGGIAAVVIIAAVVMVVAKKKKSAKAEKN